MRTLALRSSTIAISSRDRETILETIRSWPPEEQRALVRDIEEGLMQSPAPPSEPLNIYDLAGIALRPGQESPSDAQIAEWLDDRRMKEAECARCVS
jgi:hypothetical protein